MQRCTILVAVVLSKKKQDFLDCLKLNNSPSLCSVIWYPALTLSVNTFSYGCSSLSLTLTCLFTELICVCAWSHSPHLQFEMLLWPVRSFLTCPCAFHCFSPSTSVCPLLAVILSLSLSLVLSLQGASSKALRMNCSNGNTNTVCAVVPSTPPLALVPTLFAVRFSAHHVLKSQLLHSPCVVW